MRAIDAGAIHAVKQHFLDQCVVVGTVFGQRDHDPPVPLRLNLSEQITGIGFQQGRACHRRIGCRRRHGVDRLVEGALQKHDNGVKIAQDPGFRPPQRRKSDCRELVLKGTYISPPQAKVMDQIGSAAEVARFHLCKRFLRLLLQRYQFLLQGSQLPQQTGIGFFIAVPCGRVGRGWGRGH